LAIAIFVNGAKGHSALQLSRDLDVQYKTEYLQRFVESDINRLSDQRRRKGRFNIPDMDVSRHRSIDTLRRYVRDAELFREHAGAELL
jgi:hypothetical protein